MPNPQYRNQPRQGSTRPGAAARASPGGERRKLRLDQFLKLNGITATGGQAKLRIQSGEVKVNGVVETRRGHGVNPGDRVEVDGRVWVVEPSLWKDPEGGRS